VSQEGKYEEHYTTKVKKKTKNTQVRVFGMNGKYFLEDVFLENKLIFNLFLMFGWWVENIFWEVF